MYEELYAPLTDIDGYLNRLHIERPKQPDKSYLDKLIYAHQCSVPFENLEVFEFSRSISLSIDKLYHKIVTNKRGGYCFELNGLFCSLLSALGYHAYSCMARIVRGKNYITPCLHRGILVQLNETLYFCDVGYGGPMPAAPLAVQDGYCETILSETFSIRKVDAYWWALDKLDKNNQKEPIMEFTTMPQEPVEFLAINDYCSKNEEAYFRQKRIVNLRTASGNRSIMDDILTVRENGHVTETQIHSAEELQTILKTYFYIQLEQI